MQPVKTSNIIAELRSEILRLEGHKTLSNNVLDSGLGPLRNVFPKGSFPLGAVHEFLSDKPEDEAATNGFLTALLGCIMGTNGTTLWIGSSRKLYPPALSNFGVQPDRFIFIDLQKEKDVMWAMDEALKCGAITAVVGEMREISFTGSRRLQLAVEQSQVTGFILRRDFGKPNTTACVSRWRITPLKSESLLDLPGVGFPTWRVELLRIRNGKSGVWDISWKGGRFQLAENVLTDIKTGEKFSTTNESLHYSRSRKTG